MSKDTKSTYNELIESNEDALNKIIKAELTLTEIHAKYGQVENHNIFTTRDILYNGLCNGIELIGSEKNVCNWALDYTQINHKLEIVFDYINACRMILENQVIDCN